MAKVKRRFFFLFLLCIEGKPLFSLNPFHKPFPPEPSRVRVGRTPDACRPSDDVFLRQHPPVARVLRVLPLVARHKVIVFPETIILDGFIVQVDGRIAVGERRPLFPFNQLAVEHEGGAVHRDGRACLRDKERPEVLDVPVDDAVVREATVNPVGKILRPRPADTLLGFRIPECPLEAVYVEIAVADGERVAWQRDAPFDVILQDVHLNFAPVVRMREVEDQDVAPPRLAQSRHAVNLRLLQPERRVHVEQPRPERRLPDPHIVPLHQSRLHRVAGYAEGGKEEDLTKNPQQKQGDCTEKEVEEEVESAFHKVKSRTFF